MNRNELKTQYPEWTPETVNRAWLADLRRECGEDALNADVNEKFNSLESEVDENGDVWVCNPQRGHWASDDDVSDFCAWLESK